LPRLPNEPSYVELTLVILKNGRGIERQSHITGDKWEFSKFHLSSNFWKPWQRGVPDRAAWGSTGHPKLPEARTTTPKSVRGSRLDGQYGTGAILADLAGLAYVMRGKDYQILKRADVQARLHLPEDQHLTHPESGICRALYDCPALTLGPTQEPCRVVITTHPAKETQSRVGVTHSGGVYELFLTDLPQGAFTAADVVALYLHRGAFENAPFR
jgi:hypothetical protein